MGTKYVIWMDVRGKAEDITMKKKELRKLKNTTKY